MAERREGKEIINKKRIIWGKVTILWDKGSLLGRLPHWC